MKFIEQYRWEHQKLLSVDSAGIPKYDKLKNQAYCINKIKKKSSAMNLKVFRGKEFLL